MSEEDPPPPRKVKDLLQSGELDAKQTPGDSFGERHLRRHLRRPVGNSEKLWKKVDGEDPWDEPAPTRAPRRRGVYASGRFVRIDDGRGQKEQTAEKSHIPEWARTAQAKAEAARSSPGTDDGVTATPTAEDPLARLMQTIQQKNAEVEAQRAKKEDAAERIRRAREAEELEAVQEDPLPGIPGATRLGGGASERASVSHTGRIRTARGGMLKPAEVKKDKPQDPSSRRMAAGRAPPKERQAPKDIPVEMRRPPRVEYDPTKKKRERLDPSQRRMAAGRAPPKAKPKTNDLPLEMRRPPRFDPNAPEPARQAPVQHRMAAGRAPPEPRASTEDIPVEMRRPPRIDEDGDPVAPAPGTTAEGAPAPAEPKAPTPPKPVNRSPSGGGGGGLDDLFGLAQQEGRVRIGRRRKKTAEPEGDDER